jgi:cytochrome c biogenesis factor
MNPLVGWIWGGVALMIFGTVVALAPNAIAARETVPL